tara:strand:+ start:5470 stop:5769 length:300 start_codon:yes stop_codon:yes gene_type:complete
MIGYKLFRERKNGTIGSLFINRKAILTLNKWLPASSYPTKGFALRPSWHICKEPVAPHLSMKNRAWYKVEFTNAESLKRPLSQGGVWYLSSNIKIIEKL